MAIMESSVSSLPLSYNTSAHSPNSGSISHSLADSVLSFLAPGAQAAADWRRDEQHAENAYLRELYSDSTKYQRAVDDAKKAGLNPEILFSGGSGATGSVSGGTSAASTSGSTNIFKDLLKIGADIGVAIATKGKSTTVRHILDKKNK